MHRFTVTLVIVILLLTLASSMVSAGGPDGVRFQLWTGSTPEPPSRNISFADCVLADLAPNNTVHTDDLYIEMGGVSYSSYSLPYPTNEWHPVTWYVVVDIAETSTLRFWSANVLNSSIRYGVHGTDTSGAIVFHGPVYGYGDMITTTLEPGRYQFNTTASTVPEPGSLVAMLSGCIGLVGYGLRRRRRQ